MPRTNVLEENKRIMMDLEVVTKTHDCPHIVRCFGYFISQVKCSFYSLKLNLDTSSSLYGVDGHLFGQTVERTSEKSAFPARYQVN